MASSTTTKAWEGRAVLKASVLGLIATIALGGTALGARVRTEPPSLHPAQAVPERMSSIAAALGGDVESIFRFVADDVRYEPYSGVLRAAEGTLASRAGNSVDQAMLLAALLEAIEVPTRYAVGAIDEATASDLLGSAVADQATLRQQEATALFGRLRGDADLVPELPTTADYVSVDEAGAADEVAAWVDDELTGTLALIDAALTEAGLTVEGGFTGVPEDELIEHTWVQASIDGVWVDLDPSLPSIGLGESLAEPSETMDAIPDERYHMIVIDIVTEKLVDGKLVLGEPLRVTGTAAELADSPIAFTNVGSDAVPQLTRAFERMLGVITYRPLLWADGKRIAGGEMRFGDPAGSEGGGLGGGFFDSGSVAEETTAQWVDLVITSPGRDPVTTRRVIFDRIGDAAREAGSYTAETLEPLEAIDIEGNGTIELAPLHTFWWLVVSTGTPSLASSVIGLAEDDLLRMAIVPFIHHLVTASAAVDAAPRLGVRPFVDAPNVTGVVAEVELGLDGEPILKGTIDIWARSRGASPVMGGEPPSMPAAVPGVLAHVTERIVADSGDPRSAADASVSVAAVFEAAQAEGVGIRAINTSDSLAEVTLDPEARTRLEQSIDAGWLAIVPERPVTVGDSERSGWWLVDPVTGRVADQMGNGRGQDLIGKIVIGIGVAGLLSWAWTAAIESWNTAAYEKVTNTLQDDLEF